MKNRINPFTDRQTLSVASGHESTYLVTEHNDGVEPGSDTLATGAQGRENHFHEIARRFNSHNDLVDALRFADEYLSSPAFIALHGPVPSRRARGALARATSP
jgi:hypothetical protein